MENGWTERIEELEESRNNWKREWSLLNAALNMAEDRIKELEAENKRLSDLLWGARCVFCGEVIGKEKKNQDIADEVLRQHIKSCPKHPLTIARARIKELEHNLEVNGIDFSRKDGD